MATFGLLVVGSRDFHSVDVFLAVYEVLMQRHSDDDVVIITGDADGADAIARAFAKDSNLSLKVFSADWKSYGKAAGYKRNRAMHEYLAANFEHRGCIAFWNGHSKGTSHSFELAREFHTPLRVWNYEVCRYVDDNNHQQIYA